ncbi:LysR family transcriptional regulator [Citrobacter amalonaticus]|uniref:LysR family transcriptional regulator n=1 Tax=Citrobacter amalonaticus TaxID=35703 RepID=A0A2S4S3R9_CITAM|nr:LysR substrate-binding domain-containing protein [Citrobacter amalonaticus]POT59921.1 LysR family transcriptional regulator [Citrobacter amalonaticus]POT78052.1 LysR family transcriptional regulator [Citrobacter amalonaticus]POU68504.1 LysR family transcriptional regulator [Citrobacter amalonaticus]POV08108.1 LysR family transcriptional regulator [Citrobacter amalonaticus]
MELRHLRYFLAVAQEGHFGRAAERLNIVQPALSMQIKALEAELGGALFIRTSRRVELTEAGLLMQIEAKRILEQAEHARRTAERSLRGETGRLRVGFAGNAIFSGKLISDLRLFHKNFPDVELTIREVGPQEQVDAILTGLLDVGYTPAHSNIAVPDIAVRSIGDWEILVALPEDHSLVKHSCLTIEMLAGQPLVLYEAHDTHEHLFVLLTQRLGTNCHIAYRSGSTLSTLAIAATGLGLALIPAPLQQVHIPGLVYRRLNEPDLTANLVLISRSQEPGETVKAYLGLVTQLV